MKKIILIITIIICQFAVSCYDDNSSLDVKDIPDVKIDTTGMSTLSAYRFEHLVINPKITTDIDEKNLSYEWKISLDYNTAEFEVLSNEKNLNAQINLPPTQSSWIGSYILYLTVTDNVKDLKYIMTWELEVKNSLGEGLIVAHSTDNINSDISLIMCPEVTRDFDKDDIKQNIYSISNGKKIEGIVKKMLNTQIYRNDGVFVITEKSIISIKKEDYTMMGKNDDLFFNHPAPYKPQCLFRTPAATVYVNNNEITGTMFTGNPKFGLPKYSDLKAPDYIAHSLSTMPNTALTFYDEVNGCFAYIRSFASWISPFSYEVVPNNPGSPFNTSALPNKENLGAGYNTNGQFLHILKDKSNNNIEMYILKDEFPPTGLKIYDLSGLEDINNATQFIFSPDQQVVYYTTENKIYALLYSGEQVVSSLKYTAPAGEQITGLQIFRPSEYPFTDSSLPGTYKQLIMSTYSDEGKVYIMPLVNLGSGNIDYENSKVFEGFGRISAISHQK